jgi:hypothetical protein
MSAYENYFHKTRVSIQTRYFCDLVMKLVGLAIGVTGLAGLLNVCLETINRVDSYKHFKIEARSVIVQFETDKLLFVKLSRDVGLDKINQKGVHSRIIGGSSLAEAGFWRYQKPYLSIPVAANVRLSLVKHFQ